MSDHYEDVVVAYLRADRSLFVNPQCIIQLEEGDVTPKGTSWICDSLTIDLRRPTVYLCEVTYSNTVAALCKRLTQWSQAWAGIKTALVRDSNVKTEWPVRPWLFVPEKCIPRLIAHLRSLEGPSKAALKPLLTPLEMTAPWLYRTWDRREEKLDCKKKYGIPDDMLT